MEVKHNGEPVGKVWHALAENELLSIFEANIVEGLSTYQIKPLQEKYGPNLVANEEKTTWYKVLLRQFVDVLIIILFFAGIVSFFLGEATDAIAIFGIIILNGILGFTQEWKAEKALEALQNMLAPNCKVLRGGSVLIIPSSELVPGDIAVLEAGDRIPADLRIFEAINLKVDESLLTGESIAVEKNDESLSSEVPISGRTNMLWMGTNLTNGRGKGLVVASGPQTEFGKIASLTQNIKRDPTPLQKQLAVLGKQLGIFAVVISILISISGWIMGKPLLEMFMTGISLAVAIVPEGLPAVVTITLALGIRTMVKKKALVRRLQAAEALGTATVICTDKTGTLTQNQMTVQKVFHLNNSFDVTGVGYKPEGSILSGGQVIDVDEDKTLIKLLITSEICNNSEIIENEGVWESRGEATEASLKTLVKKSNYVISTYKLLREISFNSERKRMSVLVKREDTLLLLCKGAPEVLLSLASQVYQDGVPSELTPEKLAALEKSCEDFAN
ncbi:MAG: cation-translocating P-type ATPase [Oligoflexales bacterium]